MTEVEKYITTFDGDIKERLTILRNAFLEIIPEAEESIRYNMPAFKVGKDHLYFAAYKKHIGFYPVYGLPELEEKINSYRAKGTKDSLHFLHNQPLPIELVKSIIRLKNNIE